MKTITVHLSVPRPLGGGGSSKGGEDMGVVRHQPPHPVNKAPKAPISPRNNTTRFIVVG
jgi:hypothetical protein